MNTRQTKLASLSLLILLAVAGPASPHPRTHTVELASDTSSPAKRYSFRSKRMGTLFRIVLYAHSDESARQASSAAFQEIGRLEKLLSDYDPESELRRLSPAAGVRPVRVSEDLFEVLDRALQVARLTNGAFDPTIGALTRLWRNFPAGDNPPGPVEISQAMAQTGFRALLLDPARRTVSFSRTDMALDLGAIGKGFAADYAMSVLRSSGIQSALIDAGGDILVSKAPPGSDGWRIELGGDQQLRGRYPLRLTETAVATSGNSFRDRTFQGERYSHLVEPATGHGLRGRGITTVLAPNATDADAWATALSILPVEAGRRLVAARDDICARWIRWHNGQPEAHACNCFPLAQ